MTNNIIERETTDIIYLPLEEHSTINEITLQKQIELEPDQASSPKGQRSMLSDLQDAISKDRL